MSMVGNPGYISIVFLEEFNSKRLCRSIARQFLHGDRLSGQCQVLEQDALIGKEHMRANRLRIAEVCKRESRMRSCIHNSGRALPQQITHGKIGSQLIERRQGADKHAH